MLFKVCRIAGPLLLAGIATACGGTSVTELTGPDSVRCELALGSTTANAPAAGTTLSVAVSTARDCTWNASANASWLQVNPASGQGEATVTVTVSPNTSTSSRTSAVAFNAIQFQVSQSGTAPPAPACTYTLTPESRSIDEDGGIRTLRVTTNGAACSWTATSTVSWITLLSPATGTGTTDLAYRVDRNRTPNDRVGSIVIGGRSHVVRQSSDD